MSNRRPPARLGLMRSLVFRVLETLGFVDSAGDAAAELQANKGQANGYASLNALGVVPDAQLDISIAADDITDATSIGVVILTAADASAVVQAIGAQGADATLDSLIARGNDALNAEILVMNSNGTLSALSKPTAGQILAYIAASPTGYAWQDPADAGVQATAQKGQANGYASLDGSGVIPLAQLPASVQTLLGSWNATVNDPLLADGAGDTGDTYLVTVAGSQDLGSGSIDFEVGDAVVYLSGAWERIGRNDMVASVAGKTGAVTLDSDDITDATATGKTLLTAANAAAARTSLSAQEQDGALDDIAGLSLSRGVILTVDAGGNIVAVAAGTENQVLTADANGDPAFADAAGGGGAVVPPGLALVNGSTPYVEVLNSIAEPEFPPGSPAYGELSPLADPATLPAGISLGCAFSPGGRFLAVTHVASPYITIYDYDSGVPVKLANPASLPTSNGRGAAWSPDGRYLAVGVTFSPYVYVYDWNSGSPVKLADPASLPSGQVNGLSWSPSGRYLAMAVEASPYVEIYDWETGSPVKESNPASLPTGAGKAVGWSPDNRYLAVAHWFNRYLTIYDWDSGSPVKISDPASLPAGPGNGAAWSPDGRYLAVPHTLSPYLTIYDWDSGSPVKISDPATLPSFTGNAASWSADGRYLAIGHGNSPYVTIYDWESGTPIKIVDVSGINAATVNGVSFNPAAALAWPEG